MPSAPIVVASGTIDPRGAAHRAVALASCLLFLAVVGALLVWYPVDATMYPIPGESPQYPSRTVYVLLFLYAALRVNVLMQWIGRLRPVAPLLLFAALASMIAARLLSSGTEGLVQTLVNAYRYAAFVLVLPVLAYEGRRYLRHGYISVLIFAAALVLFAFLFTAIADGYRPPGVLRHAFGSLPQTSTGYHLLAGVIIAFLAWLGLGRPNLPQRLLYLAAALLMALGIALTGSRAPTGMLILGVCGALVLRHLDLLDRSAAILLVIVAFAAVLYLFRQPLLDLLPADRVEAFSRRSFSTGRFEWWAEYLVYFWEHPRVVWFGIPADPTPWSVIPSDRPPHNWVIGIICEHGIITLMFLLAFNLCALFNAWRLARQTRSDFWLLVLVAMAMIMIGGSVGNTTFLNIGVHTWLYYTLAGAVLYRAGGIEQVAPSTAFGPCSASPENGALA